MAEELSKTVFIENLDELQSLTHRCTSQEILTDIRIGQARTEETIINLSASVQELSAQLADQTRRLEQLIERGHVCHQTEQIRINSAAIEYLKEEIHRWQGQSKWEDRVWSILQAVIIAGMVALVLFFMKGGAIS